jgi:hypothetical protein
MRRGDTKIAVVFIFLAVARLQPGDFIGCHGERSRTIAGRPSAPSFDYATHDVFLNKRLSLRGARVGWCAGATWQSRRM